MGRRSKKSRDAKKANKPDHDDPSDRASTSQPAEQSQNPDEISDELTQRALENLNRVLREGFFFSGGLKGDFICDIRLSPYDIKSGKLLVPHEAAQHFSTKSEHKTGFYHRKVWLCHIKSLQAWPSFLMHYAANPPRPMIFGCGPFFERHNLRAGETLRVYGPVPPTYGIDYAFEIVPRRDDRPTWRGDLIWRRVLSVDDVTSWRLDIPLEVGRVLFGEGNVGTEELQFTDCYGNDWLMTMLYLEGFQTYVIYIGWEFFVERYKLKIMDDVKFYKHATPLHARHFFIDFGKRQKNYQ